MFGHCSVGFWRRLKMIPYRLQTGVWEDELWSLDCTIAAFIAPRLRAFQNNTGGVPYPFYPDGYWDLDEFPGNHEAIAAKAQDDWQIAVGKMAIAFEMVNKQFELIEIDGKLITLHERPEYIEGMELFHKYFGALWN